MIGGKKFKKSKILALKLDKMGMKEQKDTTKNAFSGIVFLFWGTAFS
jgi:hypothetical protein